MKICIVNSFYYPDIVGGAELSVLKLAEQLYKDGHNVYVLCSGYENKSEVINGVIVHRIRVKNIYNPKIVSSNEKSINKVKKSLYYAIDTYNLFNYSLIYNELKKINPEIVHINNIYGMSGVIWKIASKLNIPMVQTLRDYGILKERRNLKDSIRRPFYKYISRSINFVTAPSQYTLNKFLENGYFKNSESRVIYNAIDFSENDVNELLKEKKKKLLFKDKIRFVFLGRLEEEKGIKFLLDSFEKIENINIELIIGGKGKYSDEIINISNMDKRIKYIGFINEIEINKLLRESDVLIIPSLWPEPFGRVIIEAYKFAMPVIGTINGGIPELIINDKTGKLIEPNNSHELIDAINYFSNPNNILKMIDNCANEISKYNIKEHCKAFLDCYISIIK